jgi:ribose-phosphate pyrophosphokinase
MLVLLGNSLAPTLRDYFTARAQDDQAVVFLLGSIGKFVSSEAFSEIKASAADLKDQPVTIIQSLAAVDGHSANDLAMQLLLTVRTLKRNGAGPIWVVMPFAAYNRQDRVTPGRMTSVAMDDWAFLLKQAGAQGVSTIEMHSEAGVKFLVNHFGKGQVFNLDPTELFVKDIQGHLKTAECLVGGPDAGANKRADSVARLLDAAQFHFTKQHTGVNETQVTGFNGDVAGKNSITVDDMIDTGGTIENAQVTLASQGAIGRYVYAAHAIFSKGALERLFTAKSKRGDIWAITELVVTDTIDIGEKLAALIRQYGHQEVKARVRQISTGAMLYDHIARDVVGHPAMAPDIQ